MPYTKMIAQDSTHAHTNEERECWRRWNGKRYIFASLCIPLCSRHMMMCLENFGPSPLQFLSFTLFHREVLILRAQKCYSLAEWTEFVIHCTEFHWIFFSFFSLNLFSAQTPSISQFFFVTPLTSPFYFLLQYLPSLFFLSIWDLFICYRRLQY